MTDLPAGEPLANIRIVLVKTQHPGNIGSTARAMLTMGLSELVLVNPDRFPHPQARMTAAHAEAVIDRARVSDVLAAIAAGSVLSAVPTTGGGQALPEAQVPDPAATAAEDTEDGESE